MSNFVLPAETTDRLKQLGFRIRTARIRRGLSVAALALKAGISRNTLTALEHGKPGVAISVVTTVLWALGLERTLDGVANLDADIHGKTLEASRRPKRVRKATKPREEHDF